MILIPGDNLKKKDNNSYERENNYYSKYILLVNEDKTQSFLDITCQK